ncbi:hypothetical protein CAPTEDRAFT_159745 [Capitella teleta]|uniref:exodeoxyribonuclease III n=1 Tax=Capitella teleta TaxID=283909 RepID=R7UGN2_CAPTE|nr:hypothetical protein CAPTEDRAFT_159745 [Capitella teleta]|eukprot:ELU05263.1 hypothetical protein CAPTEDRAFT_159745 [Capitella teleta]
MPPKRKSDASSGDGSGAKKKKLARTPSKRESIPDVSGNDYSSEAATKDGKKWNLKFSSWNVNGIRAWVEKNGHSYVTAEDPDIFCVQETKCAKDLIPDDANIEGYHAYWLSGDKDGYSGTGLYSKQEPLSVTYGIDKEEHDKEGRVITAEFDKFYFVTAYVPNAGRGLPRLSYRSEKWDPDFREYLKNLDAKKPVVMCGDLNVAHKEIDIANPKSNKKSAGFTPQERQGFSELLEAGFVDAFRELYPEETKKYSYWTYMGNARGKNVGWRLDYFVVSEKIKDGICDSLIRSEVMGSDHCPVVLLMNI